MKRLSLLALPLAVLVASCVPRPATPTVTPTPTMATEDLVVLRQYLNTIVGIMFDLGKYQSTSMTSFTDCMDSAPTEDDLWLCYQSFYQQNISEMTAISQRLDALSPPIRAYAFHNDWGDCFHLSIELNQQALEIVQARDKDRMESMAAQAPELGESCNIEQIMEQFDKLWQEAYPETPSPFGGPP